MVCRVENNCHYMKCTTTQPIDHVDECTTMYSSLKFITLQFKMAINISNRKACGAQGFDSSCSNNINDMTKYIYILPSTGNYVVSLPEINLKRIIANFSCTPVIISLQMWIVVPNVINNVFTLLALHSASWVGFSAEKSQFLQ